MFCFNRQRIEELDKDLEEEEKRREEEEKRLEEQRKLWEAEDYRYINHSHCLKLNIILILIFLPFKMFSEYPINV